MKLVLPILFVSIALFGNGQKNLIPNGGFEDVSGCPGATNFLKNVLHWNRMEKHRGTPDQFYGDCEYNGLENQMAPGQKSHEGLGYAGSFCFGSELREYMTVRFIRPMVKDSTYQITFYVLPASGYGQGINSYGVHFSNDLAQGRSDKSLQPVSLDEHVGNPEDRIIKDTLNWTKISGKYKAKGGEEYATFGNFKSDAATKNECFKQKCIRSDRSYLLLDDVSLIAFDSTYCHPKVDTRSEVVRHEVTLKKRDITIEFWDHLRVDGDTIDVWVDDELLLENVPLTNKIQRIELELEQGTHLFKIVAVNVGSIPPNTTTIRVIENRNRSQFTLNSDYDTTECLRIVVE